MKKIAAIFILIVVLICFSKDNYNIKAKIEAKNQSAKKIDLEIAKNIIEELSQYDDIKDIVTFSYCGYCNIYIKSNKNAINKIQNTLFKYNTTETDENYSKTPDIIVVVYNDNHKKLKKETDLIKNKIANLKLTQKIDCFGERKNCVYLNFSADTLLNYSISVFDIKNFIKSQNIKENQTTQRKDKLYQIILNSDIKSAKDIENLTFFYKTNDFSLMLKDIFNIEEKEQTTLDCYVTFKNKKAQMLMLSKKSFYPFILYQYKIEHLLKNNNCKVICTKNLDKTVVYLEKQEVLDYIIANKDGLEAGYFFEENIKTPIILKYNTNEIFLYSKEYNNFISINSIATSSIENDYCVIARKNNLFWTIINKKA